MTDRQLEKARLLGIAPEEFEPKKNLNKESVSQEDIDILSDAIAELAEIIGGLE